MNNIKDVVAQIVNKICRQDVDGPVKDYLQGVIESNVDLDGGGLAELLSGVLTAYEIAEDPDDAAKVCELVVRSLRAKDIGEESKGANATSWVVADSSMRDELTKGTRVKAVYWEDEQWYDAEVVKIKGSRKVTVTFTEYGNVEDVHFNQIKIFRRNPDHASAIKKLSEPVRIKDFGVEKKEEKDAPEISEHGPTRRERRRQAKEAKLAALEAKREERRIARAEQLKKQAMERYLSLTPEDRMKSKEIDIKDYSMSTPDGSKELLQNSVVKFVAGRTYGLIGRNGVGKTTLMREISNYEIPGFPVNVRVVHVEQEVSGDDMTVLEAVLHADFERDMLLKKEAELLGGENKNKDEADLKANDDGGPLAQVYQRMREIDVWGAEGRAAYILSGLGFDNRMMNAPTSSLSGGWRMRVALAQALFVNPDLLLLDEPTNHLDFPAVLWLEDYLNKYEKTLVIVSHDRSFVNNVITDVIHFDKKTLHYYRGDYDTFERVRDEARKEQKRAYEANKLKRAHVQKFIDKFRYNAKRATLVQSRIKALARMEKLTDALDDPLFRFEFPEVEKLDKTVLSCTGVEFGYDRKHILFTEVDCQVDMDSRIGIIGANGIGKTTLINLLLGILEPLQGQVSINSHARIATFSQHHVDTLKLHLTPTEMLCELFPKEHPQTLRRHLGTYGVTGQLALQKIRTLSGGQKSRVAFAVITWKKPHVIVMDEPTNHLDLETIDALILAINAWSGGLVMVSHDQHFLQSVGLEYWSIVNSRVNRFTTFEDARDNAYARKLKSTMNAIK